MIAARTDRRPSTDPSGACGAAYVQHLRDARALASATIVNYVPFIQRISHGSVRRRARATRTPDAGDVVRFVQRQAPRLHLKRAKLLTSALRSFLRYARYRGAVTLDLAAAVPVVANWSMPSIPRAIGADQVRQLLASIDRRTAIGRRDYAIVLLLARLGLRAGEVAFLELDDIDWDAGAGQRPRKTRSSNRPASPGGCRRGDRRVSAPRTPAQHQSSRVSPQQAPIRGFLGQCAIGSIIRHALQRAGIQAPDDGRPSVSSRAGDADVAPRRLVDRNRRDPAASQSADHHDLRQGGPHGVADARVAVAGRCAMTTLRQAVHEYLRMRRDLGFKLHEAGKGLLDFVTFMEQHRASSITQALALAWAQQPSHVQPAHWAQRLSFVRGFAQLSQRDRSPHADSGAGPVALPAEAGATLSVLGCGDS